MKIVWFPCKWSEESKNKMKKTTEIDEHRKNRAFNGILKMHTQRERERERGGREKGIEKRERK